MREESYNGWTNYETWVIALWLSNERGVYEFWRDAARRHWNEARTAKQVVAEVWSRNEAAKFNLADQIREDIFNNAPDLIGMYGELLHAAFCEVNWTEIADDILVEVIESARSHEEVTEVSTNE